MGEVQFNNDEDKNKDLNLKNNFLKILEKELKKVGLDYFCHDDTINIYWKVNPETDIIKKESKCECGSNKILISKTTILMGKLFQYYKCFDCGNNRSRKLD